jgi:hypothetical protein
MRRTHVVFGPPWVHLPATVLEPIVHLAVFMVYAGGLCDAPGRTSVIMECAGSAKEHTMYTDGH